MFSSKFPFTRRHTMVSEFLPLSTYLEMYSISLFLTTSFIAVELVPVQAKLTCFISASLEPTTKSNEISTLSVVLWDWLKLEM